MMRGGTRTSSLELPRVPRVAQGNRGKGAGPEVDLLLGGQWALWVRPRAKSSYLLRLLRGYVVGGGAARDARLGDDIRVPTLCHGLQ